MGRSRQTLLVFSSLFLGIGTSMSIQKYGLHGFLPLHVVILSLGLTFPRMVDRRGGVTFLLVFISSLVGGHPLISKIPFSLISYSILRERVFSSPIIESISQSIELGDPYSLRNLGVVALNAIILASVFVFALALLYKLQREWLVVEKLEFPTARALVEAELRAESALPAVFAGVLLGAVSYLFNSLKATFIAIMSLLLPTSSSLSIAFYGVLRYIATEDLPSGARLVDGNSYSLGLEAGFLVFLLTILPLWKGVRSYLPRIKLETTLLISLSFLAILLSAFLFFDFRAVYALPLVSSSLLISSIIYSRVEGGLLTYITFQTFATPAAPVIPRILLGMTPTILGASEGSISEYLYYVHLVSPLLPFLIASLNGIVVKSESGEKYSSLLALSILSLLASAAVTSFLFLEDSLYRIDIAEKFLERFEESLRIVVDPGKALAVGAVIAALGIAHVTVMQVLSIPSPLNPSGALISSLLGTSLTESILIGLLALTKYILISRRFVETRRLREHVYTSLLSYSVTLIILPIAREVYAFWSYRGA